jgi:integrase
VNATFVRRRDAEEWSREVERSIDRGEPTIARRSRDAKTFGDLVRLHREDLQEVGKRIGRSKAASLNFLELKLGRLRIPELDLERLIQFGKDRAREGAGPVTIGIDLGYVKTIMIHAAAVHGVILSVEPIVLARTALIRLGLVGKWNERDRRPSQSELDQLIAAFDNNPRQQIPVGRIIRFAVATAMRQDEISRIEWADFDPQKKCSLSGIEKIHAGRAETISEFRSWTQRVTMPAQFWKNNEMLRVIVAVEFSHIMAGQLEQRFGAGAEN